jgi:hypothetical protein
MSEGDFAHFTRHLTVCLVICVVGNCQYLIIMKAQRNITGFSGAAIAMADFRDSEEIRELLASYGSLVVVPQSKVIVVTLQNLTPLPKGKIYRLWGVADGEKIYCGEFNPDPQGKVLIELPLDTDMSDSSSVVITVEPSQKLSYPTGETVMTGSLSL